MINAVTTTKALELPSKPFVDSASSSFFGVSFQENTQQFATLETAQMLAKILGGTVVDQKDQWRGGSQTSEYGIQFGSDGPVLNAGLIAARCQMCGVDAGLSAVKQELGSLTGKAISIGDAWAFVQKQEAAYLASTPATAAPADTTGTTPETTTGTTTSVIDPTTIASAPAPDSAAPAGSVSDPQTAAATVKSAAQGSKLANSAKQFEALMIGQMLKSVREASSGGWMGSDGGDSHFSAVEFAESHLSEAIAARGGFGLAKMVLDSVGKASASTAPSSDAPVPAPQLRRDS